MVEADSSTGRVEKRPAQRKTVRANGFAVPQLVPVRRPVHLRLVAHGSLEITALNFCALP